MGYHSSMVSLHGSNQSITAPGLLSKAPVLAFNVQEEPPLLHDELLWPGLRTMFS
jgi:hypothetical protein